jgi:hypothetical protein
MNIPEEFGKYLLLKKLREDSLGETFRGGRAGKEGIEQVVLLRVFNGQGLDGEKLWQKMSGRAAVQQGLRSPNIGSGLDLGKVRSFPYTAYDYISGKNLETLIAQASRQRLPIPVDHALLITERLALALAAAYETRLQEERVLHGFVVPQLVMVSNEGETRLLGFEVAPGLLAQFAAGWHPDEVRPYVAPEPAAGAPLVKTDDLFSLGVILYELLTGERLPAPQNAPPGGYAALIDAAVLTAEGTPLPPAVVALLKKTLVPREQRIADAVTWHKAISKLMIEGHYGSTTFNLAFFMHNLFRDEIDRETQELQAEKRLELPARMATPPPIATPAAFAAAPAEARSDMRESTGVRDAAAWASPPPPAAAGSLAGRKTVWIGVAAGLAAVALGSWVVFGRSSSPAKKAPAPAAAQPTAGASGAPGAASAAAAREAALQAQIQQMIESGSKAMEAKLKSQYDDQIKQLQRKLEESKRATAEQERGRGERASSSARETEPVATSAEGRGAAKSDPAASTAELGAAAQQQSAGSRAPAPAGPATKGAATAAASSGTGTGGAPGSPAGGSPAVPAAGRPRRGRGRASPATGPGRRPGAARPRSAGAQGRHPTRRPLPRCGAELEQVRAGQHQGPGRRARARDGGPDDRAGLRIRLRRGGARRRPPHHLSAGDQGRSARADVDDPAREFQAQGVIGGVEARGRPGTPPPLAHPGQHSSGPPTDRRLSSWPSAPGCTAS